MNYEVLLFYKYIALEDPAAVADTVRTLALQSDLLGRVIVAPEGINATLEGTKERVASFIEAFCRDERFANIDIKRSRGDGTTFPKLSVKVRNEIVGTHLKREEADPTVRTGKRLSADELHRWYEAKDDFVVVDMRNDYEYASGHFENSVAPGMRASRDLPNVLPTLLPLKNKTVVTVCTGGVRCEKMSAYLLEKGFEDVYQLDGGIHTYMQKYPGGAFKGALYTFDQRVTMDFSQERATIGRCRLCDVETEKYVNCANTECHLHFLACVSCQAMGKKTCSSSCTIELESKSTLV